jgi:hypothetical protein
MALGQQRNRQGELVVTWREMPRSPGHIFYDRLQRVLIDAGFDAFAETTCKPYYAAKMGHRRSRQAGTSGCTWSAISRG